MTVTPVKTHKITTEDKDLLQILDRYITGLEENSVVVIASKIIAITQGRVVKITEEELDRLIKEEADLYLPKEEHQYKLYITLKNHRMTYSSGIDESNGNGYQVLWPEHVQEDANSARAFLKKKFGLKHVGIIVTDMTVLPLRWGIIAGELAYSGFLPVKHLVGTPDIFGRPFNYTNVGILNGLAASAGVVMGEGAEQTPLGIISGIPFVEFVDQDPTKEELDSLIIDPLQDLYGPLFKHVKWRKGGGK
ncbi:MAG: coenzyme F420-0:L-glutamate ligase [Candidatus Levyibacteriota bacterium]